MFAFSSCVLGHSLDHERAAAQGLELGHHVGQSSTTVEARWADPSLRAHITTSP